MISIGRSSFLALTLGFTMGCNSLMAAPAPQSRIIAVVNKESITQQDLSNRLKLLQKILHTNIDNLEKQTLNTMIEEALQRQVATENEIEVSESEVKDAVAHMEESSGMAKGAMAKLLKDAGLPEKALTNQIRAHLSWLNFIRSEYGSQMQVTTAESQEEFKRFEENFQKPQFHLAEIVIHADETNSSHEAQKTLKKLRSEIMNGTTFSAAAQQFSQSATAAKGGDMGWQTEEQLHPDIKPIALSLKSGQLSEPLRVGNDYVLLALVEKQIPGQPIETYIQILQAMIPYPFLPSEEEMRETTSKLKQISQKANSCQALEKSIKSIQGAAVDKSDKLPLSSINADLSALINGLPVGKASKPVESQGGPLVVMICNKEEIKPREMTKEDAMARVAEKKYSLFARREMRDLKRHAFIEIRQ